MLTNLDSFEQTAITDKTIHTVRNNEFVGYYFAPEETETSFSNCHLNWNCSGRSLEDWQLIAFLEFLHPPSLTLQEYNHSLEFCCELQELGYHVEVYPYIYFADGTFNGLLLAYRDRRSNGALYIETRRLLMHTLRQHLKHAW